MVSPMKGDLYARKSTRDQGRSVGRQERQWRADCVDIGIEPGRVFIDPDFSASRYARKDRPDYAALLEHVRANEAEMICLWEVTRGSRQVGEWVAFLDLCRDRGVLIRVFGDDEQQTYDPRRQRDREHLINEGIKAESEVERLRSRVKPGIVDAARQGRPPGPLLYGYARIYGAPTGESVSSSGSRRREIRQVINEDEANIVRRLARDTLAGIPLQTQATRLNREGAPTPSGQGVWTGAHINRMLRKPAYEGHRVHHGKIVAENAWPAILDPQTAADLRAMLETPGRRNHADSTLAYQLSGAALCGACRRVLRIARKQGVKRYACDWRGCQRVSAPLEEMDAVVDSLIVARLRRPDAAVAFRPAADNIAVQDAKERLRALVDRRKDLHRAAAQPDGPSMALVAAAERELLPQIEAAEVRLRTLRTPPALRGYDPVDLARRWREYTVGERRAVIMALAEVVLSPVGKGGRWSRHRLAESRWRGDQRTWGQIWDAACGG